MEFQGNLSNVKEELDKETHSHPSHICSSGIEQVWSILDVEPNCRVVQV
jgi:hypothetical protein